MLKVGWEFPGCPVVRTQFNLGPQVQSFVWEQPTSHVARPGKEKKREKKLVKQFCQFRERIFPESVSFGAAEMESLVDGAIWLGWPHGPSHRESALPGVSLEGGDSQPQAVGLCYLYCCDPGCERRGRQSSLHKEKPQ